MCMLLIPHDVTQAKAKVTDGVKRMPGVCVCVCVCVCVRADGVKRMPGFAIPTELL